MYKSSKDPLVIFIPCYSPLPKAAEIFIPGRDSKSKQFCKLGECAPKRKGGDLSSSHFLLESQHRCIYNSSILNRFLNKKPVREQSISHVLRHCNLPIDCPTSSCNCKNLSFETQRITPFVLQVHHALFRGSWQMPPKKRSPESPVTLTMLWRALKVFIQCCKAFLRQPLHIC